MNIRLLVITCCLVSFAFTAFSQEALTAVDEKMTEVPAGDATPEETVQSVRGFEGKVESLTYFILLR